MPQSTVGQLLVNDTLPEDLRDEHRVLDKKGISELLNKVATRYPEKYREISHALSQLGWRSAQESGGYSFGLQHLRKSKAAKQIATDLQGKIDTVLNNDKLDDKTREDAIVQLAGSKVDAQQKAVYDESLAERNPLALQVLSGSRGNKMNLSRLRGSDLLYVDHHENVIPVPITRSYSEGLTPWEYWAGSYGARKGVLDLKASTAKAGFLAKQLAQVSHRLVVSDLDADEQDDTRGLPVDTEDTDSEGSLLSRDAGPYKRNAVLSPKMLKHLSQLGHKRILVRSPAVGGATDGGLHSRDVGVREHGNLPGRGEYPGLAASQAISEPITQGSISSKHTGGVAGQGKSISGFDYIESLVQVPEKMQGGAAHSDVDGIVGKIEAAPAGGHHVFINGEQHYVPADTQLSVKTGDRVEAGDTISSGLPNPAKIVEHKGIGEGRRYFVNVFRNTMRDAGLKANRRNVELLSRGLINHVRLDDEVGDYAPDDVVPYSEIEHAWQPREDAKTMKPGDARGKYLEKPVLHYSIGTPIRPSVQNDLDEFGIDEVTVHDKPPPFHPEMVRGMANLSHDPDWMTQMYGSGLKGSLLKSVHRGGTSDELGTSFVPGLARSVDFGLQGTTRAPSPGYKVDLGENETKKLKMAEASIMPKPATPPSIVTGTPAKPPTPPVASQGFNPNPVQGFSQSPNISTGGMSSLLGAAAPHLPGPLGGMAAMVGVGGDSVLNNFATLLQGPGEQYTPPAPPMRPAASPQAPAKPAVPATNPGAVRLAQMQGPQPMPLQPVAMPPASAMQTAGDVTNMTHSGLAMTEVGAAGTNLVSTVGSKVLPWLGKVAPLTGAVAKRLNPATMLADVANEGVQDFNRGDGNPLKGYALRDDDILNNASSDKSYLSRVGTSISPTHMLPAYARSLSMLHDANTSAVQGVTNNQETADEIARTDAAKAPLGGRFDRITVPDPQDPTGTVWRFRDRYTGAVVSSAELPGLLASRPQIAGNIP